MVEERGIVFRPWVTTRSGKVIYAEHYGKKAFPIRVGRKKPKKSR